MAIEQPAGTVLLSFVRTGSHGNNHAAYAYSAANMARKIEEKRRTICNIHRNGNVTNKYFKTNRKAERKVISV
jgi:hypothetical protein